MMKIFIIGAACTAIALADAASAQEGPGIVYDCDTAADHFSELSLPANGSFIVTGKLQAVTAAKSKDYVPMTRITVKEAADGSGPSRGGWAGIELMRGPEGSKAAGIALLTFSQADGINPSESDQVGMPSGKEIEFSLFYDGKTVLAKVDGHEKSFVFTTAHPAVNIACSTGEFLYRDLKITPK